MNHRFLRLALIFLTSLLASFPAAGQSPKSKDSLADLLFPPDALIERRADLGLTGEQVTTLRHEMETALPVYRGKQQAAWDIASALREILEAQPIQEAEAISRHAALLKAEQEIKTLEFQVMLKARQVLTPDQWIKAKTLGVNGEVRERIARKLARLKQVVEDLEKSGKSPREHEPKLRRLQQLVKDNNSAEAEKLVDELLAQLAPNNTSSSIGSPNEEELNLQAKQMTAALEREDITGIRAAVEMVRRELGERAGVPELPDEYQAVPGSATLLSRQEALEGMKPALGRLDQLRFWKVGADPAKLTAPLRAPGAVVSGMTAAARAKLSGADQCLAAAKEAADFLIWAQEQAGAGCFPFPAAKNTSNEQAMQVATRFLEQAEQAGRLHEVVRNGWAFDDAGDGGLQFDNGECGVAMFELYEFTQDKRYLDSARRAADWAMARPLCANWNYNSFSVHLLAKAYAVTGDEVYRSSALKKAMLGVMPGQLMEGTHAGRWMDAHNARPAYHYLMMSALAQLAAVLPGDHPDREAVMNALLLGLRSRNSELLEKGVMTKDKAMDCLLLVQDRFAGDPGFLNATKTTEALDVLGRLVFEQSRDGRFALGPRGWGQMMAWLAKE